MSYYNTSSVVNIGIVPEVDEDYIVTWDGTEYECTAFLYDATTIALGDSGFSDYPFYIRFSTQSTDVYVYTSSTAALHTFKIEKVSHGRLGLEYLPVVYDGTDALTLVEALNAISDAANAGITFTEEAVSRSK